MHWAKPVIPTVFLLGAGVGGCSVASEPPVEPETIVKTKYVDRPVEKRVTVRVESIPMSCMKALGHADAMKGNLGPLLGVNTKTLDHLAEGHEALTIGDGSRVNEARDALYKLEAKVNHAVQAIALEDLPKLKEALHECKITDGYKGSIKK